MTRARRRDFLLQLRQAARHGLRTCGPPNAATCLLKTAQVRRLEGNYGAARYWIATARQAPPIPLPDRRPR